MKNTYLKIIDQQAPQSLQEHEKSFVWQVANMETQPYSKGPAALSLHINIMACSLDFAINILKENGASILAEEIEPLYESILRKAIKDANRKVMFNKLRKITCLPK